MDVRKAGRDTMLLPVLVEQELTGPRRLKVESCPMKKIALAGLRGVPSVSYQGRLKWTDWSAVRQSPGANRELATEIGC